MTKTDLGPNRKVDSVLLEWFKKNIGSKFEEVPHHFEPGSLSELPEYPALKLCVVQNGSREYPGTWGGDGAKLIQERDLPDNGRMLYWYRPREAKA